MPSSATGARCSAAGVARATSLAISEFPKGRKYLISLSFRGKASVRPAQVGGFDVNIVIHGSTAVRGRGDLVAYRWALWKLTAPWTHRTRPPHLGKRCAFSTSSTGPFPSNHSRKTPKGPKIALGNPDRPTSLGTSFTRLRRGTRCSDHVYVSRIGSCKHSLCCESVCEERSAGNPHAPFCGSRRRVTASGDPVPGSATTLVYPTTRRSRARLDACG